MKKNHKAIVSLMTVVALIAAVLAYSLPVMADVSTSPRVTYQIISNAANPTVSRGSSFEAVFMFYDNNNVSQSNLEITVTSPNGSIANLPKESYSDSDLNKPSGFNESSSSSGESPAYYLDIPEKNMRYVGRDSAILMFRIYNKSSQKAYYVQKTIVECQPTAPSSGPQKSDLSLQSYSIDPEGIREGERFNLNLAVKNNGSITNNHVTAVLDGLNPDEITVDGQTDTKTIGTLDSDGTTNLSFPMICSPKMASKNYMLKVQISSDESPTAVTYNVFVPVTGSKTPTESGSDSPNASKPIIIIENYDYGGKPVLGGKEFNLALKFRNTNTAAQIENLKITVSSVAGTDDKSAAGAFTPAKSSNTFFVPKVAPGAAFSEQIALIPKSDATPNSYGVNIAFNYETVLDGKRQAIEATETIAIPLTQPDRFEVNEAELASQIFMGEPGQLNINYVNKGKSKIFNLSVKLSGNFTSGDMNAYIGNVDSGAGDTFQTTLNAAAEGTLKGTAVFSYEDASGNTKNITKEFTAEVVPMQQEGPVPSEPVTPPKEGTPSLPWFIWPIAGAVLVALIILLRVLLKKHKAKKLKKLEESLDDDNLSA